MARLNDLAVIVAGALLMNLITLVGAFTVLLSQRNQLRLLQPLLALAAGSLLGGALFHMLPMGLKALDARAAGFWLACGFTAFLVLEQVLHWHQWHRRRSAAARPVALLILLSDGLHNFIGGVGIASTFLISPSAGVAAWLAAVAHELPQEMGDYGVLVHCGWSRRQALTWNFISGLPFLAGGLVAWLWSGVLPLGALVLFAAGTFLYIAACDLVPEIKVPTNLGQMGQSLGWFVGGLVLLLVLARPQV